MDPSFKEEIAVLKPLFIELEQRNKADYLIMGQICIAQPNRKTGIFRGLYTAVQQEYRKHYTYIITEVDIHNKRLLAAYLNIGFEKVFMYHSFEQCWAVLSLKTN